MQWSDGCVEVGYGFDRSIAEAGTVSSLGGFSVGDRVTWVESDEEIPAGTVGEVTEVLELGGFCRVRFAGGVEAQIEPEQLRHTSTGQQEQEEQEEVDKDTPRLSLPEEEGVKLSAELSASAIITRDQLRSFFDSHDASVLFGDHAPTDGDLDDFLAEMTPEEVAEMLTLRLPVVRRC